MILRLIEISKKTAKSVRNNFQFSNASISVKDAIEQYAQIVVNTK